MIVLLHGKDSDAEKSNTVQLLSKFLKGNTNEHVCTPSYDSSLSFYASFKQINAQIRYEMKDVNEELTFIGCSLGGGWSRIFSEEYKGSKLIMINPSLQYYSEFNRTKDSLDKQINVFLCKDDDVFDYQYAYELYKDRADVRLFETGGHRFEQLNDQLPEILKMINNVIA
jgi:predicted esterase YcpF (UPF0227 family)